MPVPPMTSEPAPLIAPVSVSVVDPDGTKVPAPVSVTARPEVMSVVV